MIFLCVLKMPESSNDCSKNAAHYGYSHTIKKQFFSLAYEHFSNNNTFHALETLSTEHKMNFMLTNIQTTTALPPSIFIQDKDSTEHNTNVSINHNTYFDPRAFFHCPIKCCPPCTLCSMVVEKPQVQPPDERASLCERFSLHQSEEGVQAICRTSVSHNGPSCTMRNAIVKW